MHFPLDILTCYLDDQGVEILHTPAHPRNTFDWVTAVSDFLVGDPQQVIIPILEAPCPALARTPKMVVIRTQDDEGWADAIAPDDLLVRTNLPVSLLADRIQRFILSIIHWNDKMAEMVDNDCITMDLLKESEPILGAYIGLSDSTFSYIAHTPNIVPFDEISCYFVKNGNYPLEAIRQIRDMRLPARWEHQDWTQVVNKPNLLIPYPTMNRVIKRHGAYAAQVLLVSKERIGATQRFLFDLLCQKLDACLRRHWRVENPLESDYAYFLEEVLKGNTYGDERLAERAEMHGIPTQGIFEVCVVENSWRIGSADYLAKRMLEQEPRCKIAIGDGDVAILLCVSLEEAEQFADIEENVFQAAVRMGIEVGVSERMGSLELASLAFEEARIALKYGSLYSSRYVAFDSNEALTRTVFRFQRYFTYCALDQFEHNTKFVSRLLVSRNPLVRLQEADRKRGSNDFEILRTYLYYGGRINLICEMMHMHRNTVLYRLEKIREIVKEDLTDGDVRQYLRTLFFLTG